MLIKCRVSPLEFSHSAARRVREGFSVCFVQALLCRPTRLSIYVPLMAAHSFAWRWDNVGCDKKLALIFPDIFPGVTTTRVTVTSRWLLRVWPLAVALFVVWKMQELLLWARDGVRACVLYLYNFMCIWDKHANILAFGFRFVKEQSLLQSLFIFIHYLLPSLLRRNWQPEGDQIWIY